MPTILNQDAQNKVIKKGEYSNTGLSKRDMAKRANALKTEYSQWQATHIDLQTYVYPTKGFFGQSTPNSDSKIDHKTLIDEEATLGVDTFGAGMTSGFTSPTRPWFELFIDNEELMKQEPVKLWLDDVRNTMQDIFQRSNTYTTLTSMYKELATFSSACCYVGEDYENVIHLCEYTTGEYYIGRDQNGRVNAFYRRFWMTAGQMAKEFGIENCSAKVQAQYQGNTPDNWNIVNFFVEENNDRIPFLSDYKNMAFRSAYWEDGTTDDSYLRIGGYEEFPFLAPIWERRTINDNYGSGGPGWKALGAIRELQKKVKNSLIGLDKETNPPLQADASVTGDVNIMPGGITRTSAQLPNAGLRAAYEVRLNLDALELSIEKTRAKIRKFFFADLFLMMIQAEREGRQVTATEIVEKQSERLSILGPLLERWQGDDFIKALIERTFNIGMRKFIFPEPPEALQGFEIKIRYTSILAQAQKTSEIAAMDAWVASVIETAAASQNPMIVDNINFDAFAQEKARMLSIPNKIINSPEAVAALRKAKAEMMAQQQKQQQMLDMATAMKQGAGAVKDMANAPVGTGSALDSLSGKMKDAMPQ